ncbi:hypothetical protein [Chryseobacterium arthrosphaerae]|nr:hypothetical protein [Chryseobacterium arthrosphaerae]
MSNHWIPERFLVLLITDYLLLIIYIGWRLEKQLLVIINNQYEL